MSDPSVTAVRKRWMGPVLLVSLAANLLVVGIVAGWYFSSGGERPDRVSREVSHLVGPQFFRALEPDDRRALVRDIGQQRDRMRENRAALQGRIKRLLPGLNAAFVDIGHKNVGMRFVRNRLAVDLAC